MGDCAYDGGDGSLEDTATARETAQPRIRRRNRMITSCLECRRRKVRCDRIYPCTGCRKASRSCVFLPPVLSGVSQRQLIETQTHSHPAEHHDQPSSDPSAQTFTSDKVYCAFCSRHILHPNDTAGEEGEAASDDEEVAVLEDGKRLEPMSLARVDATYFVDTPGDNDADDEQSDLGIKVGRMRMTERIGGLFRPRIAEEMDSFLRKLASDHEARQEEFFVELTLPDHGSDFMAPGSTYIAPGASFVFGGSAYEKQNSIWDFLPTKAAAALLIRNYLDNVHVVAHIVHWPTFQQQYDSFWAYVQAAYEPPAWQQSLVFAVLFSAAAAMTEEDITSVFAKPKATVLGGLQAGTEIALNKAHFLRLTRLETLQALVIYLTPMCRDQISRAHSALVGMAIRLAECMGLHRDSEDDRDVSAVECQVRRILWYQLSFLDFRTCESQGPRPSIKQEDYTTKLPWNVNDGELLHTRPREEKSTWTDMTCSRLRFECIEMQKLIWHDRIRVNERKMNLIEVLTKIETFRKATEDKYGPMLDGTHPIQRYARHMMNLMIQRMYVMILNAFHNRYGKKLPERLYDFLISSATLAMEHAVALDSVSELARWKWYNGAYQQWHVAFLLLVAISTYPEREQADRIWDILDFVYGTDPSWSRAQKSKTIITAVRDRMNVYRERRGIRIPADMEGGLLKFEVNGKDRSTPQEPLTQADASASVFSSGQGTLGTRHDNNFRPDRMQAEMQKISSQSSQPTTSGHLALETEITNSSGSTPDSWPISVSGDQWQTLLGPVSPPWQTQEPHVYDANIMSVSNLDSALTIHNAPANVVGTMPQDLTSRVLEVDWQEWDQLFPSDQMAGILENTGDLKISEWPGSFMSPSSLSAAHNMQP